MLRARQSSKNFSSRKLSWRGSIAWRSVSPSSSSGSRSMKPAMSSRSNFRRARELPQDRPELGAERGEALGEEIADPFRALAQARAHDAEARALDRELEAVGNGLLPGLPAFRLLPAVEGRVDLDRAELARRIFELFRLRQLVGIEDAAPRRIGPAADADADFALRSSRGRSMLERWTFATSSS